MHRRTDAIEKFQHDHSFGLDKRRSGERRTMVAIGITIVFMLVEVAAGIAYGSLALLADGLHMASHAAALSVTVIAYICIRRFAFDRRYSFGTGKIGSLAGFASAILLAGFAAIMAFESLRRFLSPVVIAYDQAIVVAAIGLLVNGISAVILGTSGEDRGAAHALHPPGKHHDHNLRAAYLHVMADALTSFLAIIALAAGKYYGLAWMDPVMGIVGAVLVARWSLDLLAQTARVLTDQEAPEAVQRAVREAIETSDDNRIADLHVWSIGPSTYSSIISVLTHDPKAPEHYKNLLPDNLGLAHVTVEVRACAR